MAVDINDFLHGFMARSTDGLTQADTGLHADGFIDVFFEDRTDFLVFFQRQVIQGDTFVDTDQNKLASRNGTPCLTR